MRTAAGWPSSFQVVQNGKLIGLLDSILVVMPGLRPPLSAHIQQIRNDLRDRYKGGFPILKELLQNADDAGGGLPGANASEVVFLLASCLPQARHQLLRTPGLGVLNDGDFYQSDADSIYVSRRKKR